MRSELTIRGALAAQKRLRDKNQKQADETQSEINREIYELTADQLNHNIRILEWILEDRG